MWNKEDLIYFAAIIDGEGSISIEIQNPRDNRKTDYYSIRLVIVNTHLGLMNWISKTFGGKIRTRKLVLNRKQCYTWSIYSYNASNLLVACLPYFKIKKDHAEIIIEFMKSKPAKLWTVTPDVQEQRRFLYNRLKQINKTILT